MEGCTKSGEGGVATGVYFAKEVFVQVEVGCGTVCAFYGGPVGMAPVAVFGESQAAVSSGGYKASASFDGDRQTSTAERSYHFGSAEMARKRGHRLTGVEPEGDVVAIPLERGEIRDRGFRNGGHGGWLLVGVRGSEDAVPPYLVEPRSIFVEGDEDSGRGSDDVILGDESPES